MNKKLSIIIPAYNQEKYIARCIKSCFKQGFEENSFEVIVVNDGSTDQTRKTCEKFATKHTNVIVINTTNKGIESARQTGLRASSGKYIANMDSDDFLEPDILKKMVEKAEDGDYDIVGCAKYRVFFSNRFLTIKNKRPLNYTGELIVHDPEVWPKLYGSFMGNEWFSNYVWDKIYKRDLLERTNFELTGISYNEDVWYNLQVIPNSRKIFVLNTYGYNYRYGGITSKFKPNSCKDRIQLRFEAINKYHLDEYEDDINYDFCCALYWNIYYLIIYRYQNEDEIKGFIRKTLNNSSIQKALDYREKDNRISFYNALNKRDVDGLYAVCYDDARRDRFKHHMKQFIKFILKPIF